jgi:cobalamin synthase
MNSRPPFLQGRLDRTIAFIAMVPLRCLTYYRYQNMRLGVPLVSFAIGTLIAFLTMILRRPPKRITPNVLAAGICRDVLASPYAWGYPEGPASGV